MALLLQLQGALLLALRYFADMLHLTQLYDWAFAAFMRVCVERDMVPDGILRRGIRLLLRKRLSEVRRAPNLRPTPVHASCRPIREGGPRISQRRQPARPGGEPTSAGAAARG
jgi:hypothetical protein